MRRQALADHGPEQRDQRHAARAPNADPDQRGDQPVHGGAAVLDDPRPRRQRDQVEQHGQRRRPPTRPQPSSRPSRPAAAAATSQRPAAGAQRGRRGVRRAGDVRPSDGRGLVHQRGSCLHARCGATIQRAAKLTAKVITNSTRPLAISALTCEAGRLGEARARCWPRSSTGLVAADQVEA